MPGTASLIGGREARGPLAGLALLSAALTQCFHSDGTCGNSPGSLPGQMTTPTASQKCMQMHPQLQGQGRRVRTDLLTLCSLRVPSSPVSQWTFHTTCRAAQQGTSRCKRSSRWGLRTEGPARPGLCLLEQTWTGLRPLWPRRGLWATSWSCRPPRLLGATRAI